MLKKFKFILFFLALIIPFGVEAYGIENYYIDATIEEDGDLLVQEYFNLTGEFNGFERIINYRNSDLYEFDPDMSSYGGSLIHNGSNVEILEVRAVSIDSNFSFNNVGGDIFTKTYSASKGDYGVYEEEYETDGESILIYNPSSYNKAFYIKYRIKNIAIRHNDVGEIGWNVVGNELSESVGRLKMYLHIPGNTNVRAWAHGPLNGNVDIIDNETVLLTISNLSSYRAVDVRATFDLSVIDKSSKVTNVSALDKIILYETDKAEQANYERQNEEKIKIQNAENALSEFEVNVTRYNYKTATSYIDLLDDSDTKTEYLNRLEKTKLQLDKIEEEEASEALAYAQEYLTYYNYEYAKEKIEILDNDEVRKSLLNELLLVEDILREKELQLETRNYIFASLFVILLIVLGYSIYKKFVKDPDTEFNHKYFREIPNDYSPETVSYLFHKKIINSSMSATLLDLIHRKVIIAEKLSSNNYKLTLNQVEDNLVTNVESKLLDLIFIDGDTIETKDMKKIAQKKYNKFINRWNSYQSAAKNKAKDYSFYEADIAKKSSIKNSKYSGLLIIIIVICCFFPILLSLLFIIFIIYLLFKFVKIVYSSIKSIFTGEAISNSNLKILYLFVLLICAGISFYKFIYILVTQHFYQSSFIIYLLCLILALSLIPFIFNKKKRTENGAEDYKKWKALKNFLNDFGTFSNKEIPEIVLWEKYLVFATLFGCAEKVIKAMKVEMVNVPNDYFDTYMDLYVINQSISRAIISSHSYAQSAYAAAHSSSSSGGFSSGSGGGGGFSSGGGSFGGGGGGGRF